MLTCMGEHFVDTINEHTIKVEVPTSVIGIWRWVETHSIRYLGTVFYFVFLI